MRITITHHSHKYDLGVDTFATIEHKGGSITILIPEGVSIQDGLRQRAEERKKAASQASRNAKIIQKAIDLLAKNSPRRAHHDHINQ